MNQRHLLALLRRTLPVLLPFSYYESDYAIILFSICFTHFHPCTSPSLFSTFCLIIVTYQRLVSTTCIFLSTFWGSEWWDCGLPSDTRTPQWHLCAAFSVVHSVLWTVNLKGVLWSGLNALFTVDLALFFVAFAVYQIGTVYDWLIVSICSYPGHFIFICLQNVHCLPGYLHIQIFNAATYKVVIPNAVCWPIHKMSYSLSFTFLLTVMRLQSVYDWFLLKQTHNQIKSCAALPNLLI